MRGGAFRHVILAGCALYACGGSERPPSSAEEKKPVALDVGTSGDAGGVPAPTPLASEPEQKPVEPEDASRSATVTAPSDKGDPARGKFTLEDATKGLAAAGALSATIKTSQGDLKCRLLDDKAPVTVANFVGLARGVRPWKDPSGAWVERPAYDGTTFHRVIKGFMIQGGDPKGNGSGEPGYTIPDEIWSGAKHDRAGLLCMANRGRNTNGVQFFITDAKAAHLDGGYTIFGECGPVSVVHAIANVAVSGEQPTTPVTITKIEIARAGGAALSPKR
jgi:peptidyl-prolyl cis-trans isomerase A (cyclophilin A)